MLESNGVKPVEWLIEAHRSAGKWFVDTTLASVYGLAVDVTASGEGDSFMEALKGSLSPFPSVLFEADTIEADTAHENWNAEGFSWVSPAEYRLRAAADEVREAAEEDC